MKKQYFMIMNKKYIAVISLLSVFIEVVTSPAVAEMTPSSLKSQTLQSDLPDCVSSDSDIAEIQRIQKANANTSGKYDGYRNLLRADTDLELAARLAYAETIAANCPKQESRIVDLVAAVIGNRVRIRDGDVKSVVFQRNQFASSLNIYSESRYRDFLCPSNSELWGRALTATRINLQNSKSSASIPTDAVNYYLYQHSARFKAPDWKLEEVPMDDANTRECIRIFRNPAWK